MRKRKEYSRQADLPKVQVDGDVQAGCLVIEGGAFRGLYNQGVMDCFLQKNINIQTVIGVSAGALAGMNYVSGQTGRSARINLQYRHDPRYIGREAIKTSHSPLNLDFLLETCEKIDPFDMARFTRGDRQFVAVATNCLTGGTEYFTNDNCIDILSAIKASASMPFISPMVDVDGRPCLDGGCSCKIAYQWALDQGYEKVVVIKTRERGFRKKEKSSRVADKVYANYPEFAHALKNSNKMYNEQCDELDRLEESGRVYVIAPSQPVTVGRLEGDLEKLGDLYWLGYRDALIHLKEIKEYLQT